MQFFVTRCFAALLLAAAAAAQLIPFTPVLNRITPHLGSYAGGTQITIFGSGFLRQGMAGATTVYIGTKICQTIEYYTMDTQVRACACGMLRI